MSVVAAPARSRPARIGAYLNEMFPPWLMVPGGLASFFGVYLSLAALDGAHDAAIDLAVLAGGFTVVLFTLILRIYDELKDVETDLRLGRAGDPRYADRAIVTGRVTKEDIVALRWIVTGLLVVLNVGLGWPWPGLAFAAVLVATWLSLQWFFWPPMKNHLLVAFATHNPLSVLFTLYVVALYASRTPGAALPASSVAAVVVGHWGPMAAWEVARKIRAADEETDYVTYTRILGVRAALLPIVFAGLSLAGLVVVAERAGISRVYSAVVVAAALPLVVGCIRFVARPSAKTSALRPLAELYAATVSIATAIAYAVHVGVAWR